MKKRHCYVALLLVMILIQCAKDEDMILPISTDNQIDLRTIHFTLTHCPESDCRKILPLKKVDIDLYRSRQDFLDQISPLHTVQTDKSGIVQWSFRGSDSLYYVIHADDQRSQNIPNDLALTPLHTTSFVDFTYHPSCSYSSYGAKSCDYNINFQDPIVGQKSHYAFWTASGYGTDQPTELEYTGDILEVEILDIDQDGNLWIQEYFKVNSGLTETNFINLLGYTYTDTLITHWSITDSYLLTIDYLATIGYISPTSFLGSHSITDIGSGSWSLAFFDKSTLDIELTFNGWIPSEWLNGYYQSSLSNSEINGKIYDKLLVEISNFEFTLGGNDFTAFYTRQNIIRTYRNRESMNLINGYDLIPN